MLDVVRPILKGQIFGFPNATLNLAARFEYVDWNVGSFQETGGEIGDDVLGIVPAISFRPSAMTAFRLNYRYQSQRDILNNPAARTGGLQVGISSYF